MFLTLLYAKNPQNLKTFPISPYLPLYSLPLLSLPLVFLVRLDLLHDPIKQLPILRYIFSKNKHRADMTYLLLTTATQ
jgi:hypothetical protein